MPPSFPRPSSTLLALVFLLALIRPTSSSLHHPYFSLNKRWPSDNPPTQHSSNSTANVSATPQTITSPADYACRPIGPCQPCPPEELESPVCKVYQNRRVVDCLYLGNQPSAGSPTRRADGESASELDGSHQNEIGEGGGGAEFQTWEACERVVAKERRDFFEFVSCNIFIALLSLLVYGFRTKHLITKQYGNLAARIGILPT